MSSTTGARPPLRRLRRTEFLPPDEHVEIPYRFTPEARPARRHPRAARARRLRRAPVPAVGAAGAVGDALPGRGAEQPDPHGPDRGAARDDRRQARPAAGDERPRDHRPRLAAGPAEDVGAPAGRAPPARSRPQDVAANGRRAAEGTRVRSAHPGHDQERRPPRAGGLHPRAPGQVPRRRRPLDHASALPPPGARRAHPRPRRRDLARRS